MRWHGSPGVQRGISGAAVIAEILRGEPKPMRDFNPELPEEVQRIVSKALEKDRADRYQTANDLMVDLRRLKRAQMGSSETATKTKAAGADSGWLRRKRVWIKAIVGAALIRISGCCFGVRAEQAQGPIRPHSPRSKSPSPTTIRTRPLLTDGSRLYFQSDGHPVEMSVRGGSVGSCANISFPEWQFPTFLRMHRSSLL